MTSTPDSRKQKVIEHLRGNRLEPARTLLDDICADDTNDIESWHMLSEVNGMLGHNQEAETCARRVLDINPDFFPAHLNLGKAMWGQGRMSEARLSLERAVELNPDDEQACITLGSFYIKDSDRQKAEQLYQSLLDRGSPCAVAYSKALDIDQESVDSLFNRAQLYKNEHKYEQALELYRRILKLQPDNPKAIAIEAEILERQGDIVAAGKRLLPLIDQGTDNPYVAAIFAQLSRGLGREWEAAKLIERILVGNELEFEPGLLLRFALGKLYDHMGEYDQAFVHYCEANRLKRGRLDYQSKQWCDVAAAARQMFSADFLAAVPRVTNRSEVPVFVVGMPRSGTSLIEQILASHSQVFGAGELEQIRSISHELGNCVDTAGCVDVASLDALAEGYLDELDIISVGAKRVVDKMPGNYRRLGMIEMLFPNARIIHIERNPVDTCLSCFFQNFVGAHQYAYDLVELGEWYVQYQLTMAHWKSVLRLPVLEVQYEALVADPERRSRELVEFCGLEWEPKCLEFYKTPRAVTTSSYDQVRRPIYSGSVSRWEHYAQHLGPLLSALEAKEE